MIGQCPLCLSTDVKLINHHWFEIEQLNIEHEEYICHSCNIKLVSRASNHILPSWAEQINIIRDKKSLKTKEPTITRYIRLRQSLLDTIAVLAQKRKWSINAWIVNTIERESRPRN